MSCYGLTDGQTDKQHENIMPLATIVGRGIQTLMLVMQLISREAELIRLVASCMQNISLTVYTYGAAKQINKTSFKQVSYFLHSLGL